MKVAPLCIGGERAGRARSWAVVGIVFAIAFASHTARADATFALGWHADRKDGACFSEADVRGAVEEKLGRPVFTDQAHADIFIEGRESVAGTLVRARVVQYDRGGAELGARELDAENCAELLRTTTVVVALFIEPDGPRKGAPTEGVDAPPDALVAVGAHDAPARGAPAVDDEATRRSQRTHGDVRPSAPRSGAVVPSARRSRRFVLRVGVGAGVAIGLLPSASPSVRVLARLENPDSRWSFDWSAGYAPPQEVDHGSVGATFSAVDQQVRACVSPAASDTLRVDACGGASFGAVLSGTRGIRFPNNAARSLSGPTAALALRVGEPRAALRIEFGLTVPIAPRSPNYLTREGEIRYFYSTGAVVSFAGVSGTFTIF